VAALADAAKDTDRDVRRAAASSLGVIGPAALDAVPALTQATTDPDPSVRGAAIETLGRIGGPSVVPALMQAMKDPRTGSLAIPALGLVGPAARDALPVLKNLRSQEPSRDSEVETAIRAIEGR
jgi:HEAT repeat protein